MDNIYLTIDIGSDQIYIRSTVIEAINNIEGLILDCDGVLIDNFKLYSEAVKKTVRTFFESFNVDEDAMNEVYREFKARGLFNNDWIITSCIILSIICRDKNLLDLYFSIKPDLDIRSRLMEIKGLSQFNKDANKQTIISLLSRLSSPSIKSLSEALETEESIVRRLMNLLLLPMKVGEGLIPTVFEEIYHGPLINKIYKVDGILGVSEGLVQQERLNIDECEIAEVYLKFNGKIGLLTGRPKESAEYSLSPILNYISSRLYMEDGGGDKPSTYPLRKLIGKLKAESTLVIGDSAEEVIMVNKAKREGLKCFSCGVTNGEMWRIRLFKSLETDIICGSIKSLFNFLR